jgi:hypothetical protein
MTTDNNEKKHDEGQQQHPEPEHPEVTPGHPIAPEAPQPTQPFYSPSQPGAPLRTPDFVPGQPAIPTVPGGPHVNPEQTPPLPTHPGEAPAPVAVPDPGGPRVVGPDGFVIPAPGGGGRVQEGKLTPERVLRPQPGQQQPGQNNPANPGGGPVHDPNVKTADPHRTPNNNQ